MVDLSTPQAKIADHYMSTVKGIEVKPHLVEQLDDQPCWYFYYSLKQGELELEVFFDEEIDDWAVCVTAFPADI